MSPEELRELLKFAVDATREAGRLTLRYFQNDPEVEIKADRSPVTAADEVGGDERSPAASGARESGRSREGVCMKRARTFAIRPECPPPRVLPGRAAIRVEIPLSRYNAGAHERRSHYLIAPATG